MNFDAADKNKDNRLNLSEWILLRFWWQSDSL
jgi:hypothetical protein